MQRVLLVLFLCVGCAASAQTADGDSCHATLTWLDETFSNNDAGFPGVVERKGERAYAEMRAGLMARASGPSSSMACGSLLSEYLAWFRRGHAGIYPTQRAEPSGNASPAAQPSADELRAQYAGVWSLDLDPTALRDRFAAPTETTTLEGIWTNGTYEVAVVRADTSGQERYLGVVLESQNPRWQARQVKFELFPTDLERLRGTLWMSDHSAASLTRAEPIGNVALGLWPIDVYKRTAPAVVSDLDAEIYLEDVNARGPVFRQLSAQTTYLRVPDFDASQKEAIDSVLAAHHDALTSTPGLVIDIRGNGGGADASYARLIDYLYTTPIRQTSAEMRSTSLNNGRNDAILADPEMPEEIKTWIREMDARLAASDAEWVSMSDERVVVERRDTVYAYPARVAILVDGGNGSTAEQFLLDAQQSFKVKTLGVTTFGSLDASNVNVVTSPDGRYELAYAISRSFRGPDMVIDGVGLTPDVYLDASVPRWQWVRYARDLVEQ